MGGGAWGDVAVGFHLIAHKPRENTSPRFTEPRPIQWPPLIDTPFSLPSLPKRCTLLPSKTVNTPQEMQHHLHHHSPRNASFSPFESEVTCSIVARAFNHPNIAMHPQSLYFPRDASQHYLSPLVASSKSSQWNGGRH